MVGSGIGKAKACKSTKVHAPDLLRPSLASLVAVKRQQAEQSLTS